MVDPNTNGDEPRLVLTGGGFGARVVLAEVDAPGSLHYLLEAEGFQVVGCAGDDDELGRVLGQDLRPDVIVLDADIVVTSSLVARELAPDAHLIAIWPEDVQPPPGGERISPRQVYEDLGPAIRRYMDRRSAPVALIDLPADEPAMASVVAGAGLVAAAGAAPGFGSSGVFTRAASRMSVLSVTLIAAILFTMGVAFALGGFRSSPAVGPPRFVASGPSDAGRATGTADPLTGRVPNGGGSGPSGNKPPKDRSNRPSDHHKLTGSFDGVVVTTGTGGGGGGTTGGATGDQGGGTTGGQGDQGGGSGGQDGGSGGQGGGQGDQGGGQGDQGGGSGGQGGGSGGQGGGSGGQGDQGGGSGNHGGQGDHGGNGDGQHGGDGQGDQGGDGQGEDDQGGQGDQDGDDQGENDQGGDQQGDQSSHQGDQAPHGDGHGAHSSNQGQSDQGN